MSEPGVVLFRVHVFSFALNVYRIFASEQINDHDEDRIPTIWEFH